MPMNSILFEIQMLLYVGSGVLLAGSLAGLYLKSEFLLEGRGSLLSRGGLHDKRGEDFHHEKRRHRRLPSSALLELIDASGTITTGNASIEDISLTGACFHSPLVLAEGERIQARLHSSSEGILHRAGRFIAAAGRSLVGAAPESRQPVHPRSEEKPITPGLAPP